MGVFDCVKIRAMTSIIPSRQDLARQALLNACAAGGFGTSVRYLALSKPALLLHKIIEWARTILDEDTPPARRAPGMAADRLVGLVADYLVENGADVNVTDEHGRTPLAVLLSGRLSQCHAPLARLLLQAGADTSGWTVKPLGLRMDWTIDRLYFRCKDAEIVTHLEPLLQILIDARVVDVNEAYKTALGVVVTPLHRLCGARLKPGASQCTAAKIKSLTGLGADPNSVNEAGETPLHHLLAYGRATQGTVRALLEAGADPALVPNLYDYVYAHTKQPAGQAIMTLLEDYGAPPCPPRVAAAVGLSTRP